MKKLLIVDDDALIRATLHTIVDWNELGYEVAGDAQNGEQALQILKKEQIDLVFTDMKMPVMDGIGLMQQINQMEKKPQIVALSGYDDFSLVRSAFKLGAFEIDEFKENTVRFQSSFEEYLVKPMVNIAQQIPRIANKCVFISLSPGLYFLYIPMPEGTSPIVSETIVSLCKQLKSVWNNYMNLPVSVGISRVGRNLEDFRKIIFPLLAPATATVVIIKSISIINDMYIPYLYMPKNKLRTLTTFLMDYANAQEGSWQTLAAGIIVIMIPTVLIYIFFQKYILAGVAAGAVKG